MQPSKYGISEPSLCFIAQNKIDFDFEFFTDYNLTLQVNNGHIKGYLDDKLIIEVEDKNNPLDFGGAGIVAEDGTMCTDQIRVS